jgi:phage terminase small subunit
MKRGGFVHHEPYDPGMRPKHLSPAGRTAWDRAVAHVEAREGDVEALKEAIELYARAVDRSWRANQAWRKAGRPLVIEHANGPTGVHPLVKAIEEADRSVWRYGRALGLNVPGVARRVGHPTSGELRQKRQAFEESRAERIRRRQAQGDPRLEVLKSR